MKRKVLLISLLDYIYCRTTMPLRLDYNNYYGLPASCIIMIHSSAHAEKYIIQIILMNSPIHAFFYLTLRKRLK